MKKGQTVNKFQNFQCQTVFKNAKFVKSGIEKYQLVALVISFSSSVTTRDGSNQLGFRHTCFEKAKM